MHPSRILGVRVCGACYHFSHSTVGNGEKDGWMHHVFWVVGNRILESWRPLGASLEAVEPADLRELCGRHGEKGRLGMRWW